MFFRSCIVLLFFVITGAEAWSQEGATSKVSIAAEDETKFAAAELAKYLAIMYAKSQFVVAPAGARGGGARIELRVTREIAEEEHAWSGRDNRTLIEGGSPRAVLQGTYRYLESLGCHWFAPAFHFYGGAHETVPVSQERFNAGAPATGGSAPKMKFRKLYVEEGISHTTDTLRQIVEWMPKVGYNVLVVPTNYGNRGRVMWDNWRSAITPELQRRNLLLEVGGHGYENFLNEKMEGGRLFEQHPEWFGVDDKGQRSRQKKRVFCTSNPDAVAYLTKGVVNYLESRPEINIFALWPPDSAVWCQCEKCVALGAEPDRQAVLLNDIAKLMKKDLPRVRLETIAYGKTLQPPAKVALDPSILVDFCPINQQFEVPIFDESSIRNAEYKKAFLAWSKAFKGDISIYTYYRKYAWKSLPIWLTDYMQYDLSWYAENGADGVSIYSEPDDWAGFEINHYLLPRLGWDPEQDVEALLDGYVTSRYGECAAAAENVIEWISDRYRLVSSVPFTTAKPANEVLLVEERLQERLGKFTSTCDAAKDDSTVAGRLRLAAEYALLDAGIQALRAEGKTAEMEKLVAKMAEFLESHADKGVFTVYHGTELRSLKKKYGLAETAKRETQTTARDAGTTAAAEQTTATE